MSALVGSQIWDAELAKSLAASDKELGRTTMQEMRRQIPLFIQMAYSDRQSKYPKGRGKQIYRLPTDWPREIPFHDPNNKRQDGRKPQKSELLSMFKQLILLCKKNKVICKQETPDAYYRDAKVPYVPFSQPNGMSGKGMYEETGSVDSYNPYLTQPRPDFTDSSLQPRVKGSQTTVNSSTTTNSADVNEEMSTLNDMISSLVVSENWKAKIDSVQKHLQGRDYGVNEIQSMHELCNMSLEVKRAVLEFNETLNKICKQCAETKQRDLMPIAIELKDVTNIAPNNENNIVEDFMDSRNSLNNLQIDTKPKIENNTFVADLVSNDDMKSDQAGTNPMQMYIFDEECEMPSSDISTEVIPAHRQGENLIIDDTDLDLDEHMVYLFDNMPLDLCELEIEVLDEPLSTIIPAGDTSTAYLDSDNKPSLLPMESSLVSSSHGTKKILEPQTQMVTSTRNPFLNSYDPTNETHVTLKRGQLDDNNVISSKVQKRREGDVHMEDDTNKNENIPSFVQDQREETCQGYV